MKNELHITRTYQNGALQVGFVQTDKANDYYFVYGETVDGPYADEGEAYGGWYRQHA